MNVNAEFGLSTRYKINLSLQNRNKFDQFNYDLKNDAGFENYVSSLFLNHLLLTIKQIFT